MPLIDADYHVIFPHYLACPGSGTSSGSENDVTNVQVGLCSRQQHVSSTDTYIAREALELLVTCLQLRTSLLCS